MKTDMGAIDDLAGTVLDRCFDLGRMDEVSAIIGEVITSGIVPLPSGAVVGAHFVGSHDASRAVFFTMAPEMSSDPEVASISVATEGKPLVGFKGFSSGWVPEVYEVYSVIWHTVLQIEALVPALERLHQSELAPR